MGKPLVRITPITVPATINSNQNLLADISAVDALNPKEKVALSVYCRAAELFADGNVTIYNPATVAGRIQLAQDTNCYFGHIPCKDIENARVAIDWNNAQQAGAALPADVDLLRALLSDFAERPIDELIRMATFMRLELRQ